MPDRRMRGFTLIEMMIVVAIAFIAAVITLVSIQPALKQSRVSNAYNTSLGALRRAREASIGERRRYLVQFSNAAVPSTVSISPADPAPGGVRATYSLPTDVAYTTVTGFPNPGPDGFGAGTTAIDFDQNIAVPVKTDIYFYPDGSAQDVNNNINNGVVYVARPGDLNSGMAITLWGATGRIRGWRFTPVGGNKWIQQ
jgi:prepilin-type N-terminal cleavage/methylation domain-containing protein